MILDRDPKAVPPFAKDLLDFEGVFLRDVVVAAWRYEANDVGQGRLGGISRCQANIRERKSRFSGGRSVTGAQQEGSTVKRGRAEQQRSQSHALKESPPGQNSLFVFVLRHP